MKKILFFLLLAASFHTAFAQDCSATYGLLKAGSRLEYTTFNKKGEVDMTIKEVCQKVENSLDTVIAVMDARTANAKGEETSAHTFHLKCLAGVIYMNMQTMLPTQQGSESQSSGMEMQIEGGDMAYPATMKPGDLLPDAEMVARASTGGMQLMKMRYKIVNRKVEGAEKLTTKAGTFDCMKITYDLEMNLLGKKTYHSAQWIAKNVGMVKTESYDKKGGLESSMQLTLFQK